MERKINELPEVEKTGYTFKYWSEEEYDWQLEHGNLELLLGSSSADIRLSTKVAI